MDIKIWDFIFLYCLVITMTFAELKSQKQLPDFIMKTIKRIKTKRAAHNSVPYKYLPATLTLNNYDSVLGGKSGLGHAINYDIGNIKSMGTSSIGYRVPSKRALKHRYTTILENPFGLNHLNVKTLPSTMSLAVFNPSHSEGKDLQSHHGALPEATYTIGNVNDLTALNNHIQNDLSKHLTHLTHVPGVAGNGHSENINFANILPFKNSLSLTYNKPSYAIGHQGLGHFGSAYKQFDIFKPHLDSSITNAAYTPSASFDATSLNSGRTLGHYLSSSFNGVGGLGVGVQDSDYSGAATYSSDYHPESHYAVNGGNNGFNGNHESIPTYVQPAAKPEGFFFKKSHFIE